MSQAVKVLEPGSSTIHLMPYWLDDASVIPEPLQRTSVTSSTSEQGSFLDALAALAKLRYENVIFLNLPIRIKKEEFVNDLFLAAPRQVFRRRARIKFEGAGSFLTD